MGRLVQTGVGRRAAGERILVAQRAAAHRRIEAERVASPSCATDTSSSSSMMAHHRAPVGAQVNVLQHLPKISNKHALVISNNSRRENLGQGRGGSFFFSLSLSIIDNRNWGAFICEETGGAGGGGGDGVRPRDTGEATVPSLTFEPERQKQ